MGIHSDFAGALAGDAQGAAFRAALLADPTDRATHAVVADWLEERGDCIQAEFHRWYASGAALIWSASGKTWSIGMRGLSDRLRAVLARYNRVRLTRHAACGFFSPMAAISALKYAWFQARNTPIPTGV